MNTLEKIDLCKEYYNKKVRLFFDSKDFVQVRRGITNLIIEGLYPNFQDFFPYRSAPICFAKADEILEQIRNKEPLNRGLLDEFEAYLAETRLSIFTAHNQGN